MIPAITLFTFQPSLKFVSHSDLKGIQLLRSTISESIGGLEDQQSETIRFDSPELQRAEKGRNSDQVVSENGRPQIATEPD